MRRPLSPREDARYFRTCVIFTAGFLQYPESADGRVWLDKFMGYCCSLSEPLRTVNYGLRLSIFGVIRFALNLSQFTCHHMAFVDVKKLIENPGVLDGKIRILTTYKKTIK